MSTQSPVTVAFRALVMLACVILLPLAAIFGTSLPGPLKELLSGKWGKNAAPSQPPGDAPAFNPVYSTASGVAPPGPPPVAPGWPNSAYPQPVPMVAAPNSLSPPVWGNPSRSTGSDAASGTSDTLLASYESHLEASQPASSSPWQSSQAAGRPDFSRMSPVPTGPIAALEASSDASPRPYSSPVVSGQTTDRFTYMERRLRELGCTYCLLETWGNQGEYYRFHCRMSVAGSSNYTRHFEATDPDPLQAMGKVLAEVEAWRSSP